MQLFYVPELIFPDSTLPEEEAKHAIKVLRLAVGDEIHLTDGRGTLCHGRVSEVTKRDCTVHIERTEEEFEKLPYRLVMAVAPTKNFDRYEWFLEKATEVGVSEFVPLESAHSERRVFRAERARKVVTAAMKQSLKAYMPVLHDITSFKEFVRMPFDGQSFIAHCDAVQTSEGKRYLASIVEKGRPVRILIGPEGDFSPEEITFAVANGFQEITLGTQRLRTETAAVVATVMVSVANN